MEKKEIFLGGPKKDFHRMGRDQLDTSKFFGLERDMKLLDVGAGCLRGGKWFINYLDKGCYYGIEPNKEMLEYGINNFLEKKVVEEKKPKFNNNDQFNFDVFNEKFDFFVARSIWTHSSKKHIIKMLKQFVKTKNPGATFLTSYLRPSLTNWDYKGDEWVGKSHRSSRKGAVTHNFRWIKRTCESMGLIVHEYDKKLNKQTWLVIR